MAHDSSVIVTELERELLSTVIEQQNGSRQFSGRDRARARAIVHLKVLDLTRKMQKCLHVEIAHASNATMSLRAFICVCVRLRVLCAYVRTRARTYIDKVWAWNYLR